MSENTEATTGTNALEAAAAALTGDSKPLEDSQGEPAENGEGEGSGIETRDEAARKVNRDLERKLKDANARVRELEIANENDIERAQREAREAQEVAAKAPIDAFREAAVIFGGIPADDAELFLNGSDLETLKKQATRLKERTPTAPKPDPSQGAQHALALNSDGLTQALERAVGGARPH